MDLLKVDLSNKLHTIVYSILGAVYSKHTLPNNKTTSIEYENQQIFFTLEEFTIFELRSLNEEYCYPRHQIE